MIFTWSAVCNNYLFWGSMLVSKVRGIFWVYHLLSATFSQLSVKECWADIRGSCSLLRRLVSHYFCEVNTCNLPLWQQESRFCYNISLALFTKNSYSSREFLLDHLLILLSKLNKISLPSVLCMNFKLFYIEMWTLTEKYEKFHNEVDWETMRWSDRCRQNCLVYFLPLPNLQWYIPTNPCPKSNSKHIWLSSFDNQNHRFHIRIQIYILFDLIPCKHQTHIPELEFECHKYTILVKTH